MERSGHTKCVSNFILDSSNPAANLRSDRYSEIQAKANAKQEGMGTQAAGCWRSRKPRDSQERTKICVTGTQILITCKPRHPLPSSGKVTFLEGEYSLWKDTQESKREGGETFTKISEGHPSHRCRDKHRKICSCL